MYCSAVLPIFKHSQDSISNAAYVWVILIDHPDPAHPTSLFNLKLRPPPA